jgi:CheY-like chemotaxis protein
MPKKILIVDDDPDVILFLSTVLKDNGYIPCDASNGREGLERARSDHPDLILLDLMMPVKSGIALLSDLKKDDALKEIPVIMVTGVSGETGIDLEAFFKKGAVGDPDRNALKPEGYIEKPVDPQKLLKLIKDVLS